jgi:hypothetical protein
VIERLDDVSIERLIEEFSDGMSREKLVREKLAPLRDSLHDLRIEWRDSSVDGVYTFMISTSNGNLRDCLLERIFPLDRIQLLQDEDLLFSEIPRQNLHAPAQVTSFLNNDFKHQICEYGRGSALEEEEFSRVIPGLFVGIWSVTPPEALVRASGNKRPLLHQRLDPKLMERLSVAADSEEEKRTVHALHTQLPGIRDRIAQLPLHVYNPDLSRGNLVRFGENDVRVMSWIRWSIEPLGVGLPTELIEDDVRMIVEKVRSSRDDLNDMTAWDIALVNASSRLLRNIKTGLYQSALEEAAVMVNSIQSSQK